MHRDPPTGIFRSFSTIVCLNPFHEIIGIARIESIISTTENVDPVIHTATIWKDISKAKSIMKIEYY